VRRSSAGGIAAAQAIRERFAIPVVFLTAFVGDASLERAKVSESCGYIVNLKNSAADTPPLARHSRRRVTKPPMRKSSHPHGGASIDKKEHTC
jgi:CheY-like chemotaxis protein